MKRRNYGNNNHGGAPIRKFSVQDSRHFFMQQRDQLLSSVDEETRAIEKNNPHVLQAIQYDGIEKSINDYTAESRFLDEEQFPEKEYTRRKGHIKSVIYWSERRDFLAILEFLTKFSSKEKHNTLIHVGCGKAMYFPLLMELFPYMKFILYDPKPIKCLPVADRIIINPECPEGTFTIDVAKKIKEKYPDSLFACTARTKVTPEMRVEFSEKIIQDDMLKQMAWVQVMKCRYNLLRFRPPYNHPVNKHIEKVVYLDGKLILPAFATKTGCETFLLVEGGADTRIYDHKKYENQMFYFNTVLRTKLFKHPLENEARIKTLGLDQCYDCATEVNLVGEYCKRFSKNKEEKNKIEEIWQIIKKVDEQFSGSGRRVYANHDDTSKKIRNLEKSGGIVRVSNLHEGIKEDQLFDLFSRAGTIRKIEIDESSIGNGIVQFENPENAHDAFKYLDGCRLLGKNLQVRKSQTKRVQRNNRNRRKGRNFRRQPRDYVSISQPPKIPKDEKRREKENVNSPQKKNYDYPSSEEDETGEKRKRRDEDDEEFEEQKERMRKRRKRLMEMQSDSSDEEDSEEEEDK